MMAPPQRLEDRVSIKLWGKEACEPPCRSEEGGTWKLGTGSTLVTVGTADDAHTVVLLEGVM